MTNNKAQTYTQKFVQIHKIEYERSINNDLKRKDEKSRNYPYGSRYKCFLGMYYSKGDFEIIGGNMNGFIKNGTFVQR